MKRQKKRVLKCLLLTSQGCAVLPRFALRLIINWLF